MRRSMLLVAIILIVLPAAAFAQGVRRAYMDTSVKPCEDFFRYANGAWVDTVQIPAQYTSVGAGREIFDRNQEALRRVLERTARNAATEKNPSLAKVGNYYAVLLDSARADREKAAPLAADLARIDGIKTQADVVREFARLAAANQSVPFAFGPEADPMRSSMTIGRLAQGGLGLPDRDFYFKSDARSDTTRREYVAIMTRLLELSGLSAAAAGAAAPKVMALETALAESSMTLLMQRDPHAVYHKMAVGQLQALAPQLDWPLYFRESGIARLAAPSESLDVAMPGFARRVAAELDATPLDTWRAYLRWHTVRLASNWLSADIYDEAFKLQRRLLGTTAPQPRWKRAANEVDTGLGEALGQAYVATEFPPSSKARVQTMVDNLRAAFRDRIRTRPWMSEATRRQALGKLDAIIRKIGYPDRWRDYSTLQIDPKLPAYENLRRADRFEARRQFDQIGKPVDRAEWGMTPPTVNAYYNPTFNEIVFPAGILQAPLFDAKADDAVNYGAIGMVIGHELTHGFDDEGRQYDAQGNLRDWWTAEDAKHFEGEAQKVVDQYSGYVGVDTMHLNGKLTLGENIADIGGLALAHRAYELSLGGKPAPVIDGFTGDQRFFLGFAQGWRNALRPQVVRLMIQTNPHSPARWRVNGAVSANPEFAKAFGCKDGQPMARESRPDIW